MKAILTYLTLFSAMLMNTSDVIAQTLEELRWKNRVLIVKGSRVNSPAFDEQIGKFKSSKEVLKERKIAIYQVEEGLFKFIDYTDKLRDNSGKVRNVLRKGLLDNSKEFEVILIGLDGGVKLKKSHILSIEELFRTIDSMPMRSNELRK
jgi:predicted DNA-binding protein (UPF0278 family)